MGIQLSPQIIEIAKAINAKAEAREAAEPDTLKEFLNREKVESKIAAANAFMTDFPKWWQAQIAPTVEAAKAARFLDGEPYLRSAVALREISARELWKTIK